MTSETIRFGGAGGLRLRVVALILLILLLIAVIAVWGTSRAEAVASTTGSCSDAGGIMWQTRVNWGAVNNGPKGQRRITVDFAGWTTDAQSLGTNSIVTTYNPDGTRRQALSKTTTFDYHAGTSWDGRNPANPTDGPGKTKITISVGGDSDGKPSCVVEHVQPVTFSPTVTPTSPDPTTTVTPTSPGPTTTVTPTSPGPTTTVTPTSPGPTTVTPTSPGPTTTVTQTSTSSSSSSVLALPRDKWEGADYWKQYPRADAAGWDDPSFFPISVFLSKPAHADALKSVGVNTYMQAEHNDSLSTITSRGMFVLAQGEWSQAEVGIDPGVVGWQVSDECDMGYEDCTDWRHPNDEYGQLGVQQGYVDKFRSYQDGRFLEANFGNGVLRTFWAPNTMDDHIKLMDASSVDKYAYTSPGVRFEIERSPDWPVGLDSKRAATYGWLQDQMERFQDPAKPKPNWVFVETAKPLLNEAGAETITPTQISGAVWSAIIHGARGIAYFQHNNNSACGTYSLVDCSQALKDAVRAVNTEIANLAPVLNTQSYLWDFRAGADTMLKVKDGYAYIFAGVGLKDMAGSKTFTLPSGVNGSTVEVVGESRSISVSNGQFTDVLAAEYAHHVYRIALAN
jgi:hypothetical protein